MTDLCDLDLTTEAGHSEYLVRFARACRWGTDISVRYTELDSIVLTLDGVDYECQIDGTAEDQGYAVFSAPGRPDRMVFYPKP